MLTTADSLGSVQPGLPLENYMWGLYAVPDKRAVTGIRTVWTSAWSYATILMILLVICIAVSRCETPKPSDFPIVDLLLSANLEEVAYVRGSVEVQDRNMNYEEMFAGLQLGGNKEIVKRADQVWVRLVVKSPCVGF